MAQISYGSITITDVSDGQPGAQGASVEKVEIEYYRRLSGAAAPTEQSTGSATIPDYIDGCTYYTRSVTYLDDNGQHTTVKGQWIEDTALTAETQKAYEAWVNAAEAATKTARLIYSEVRTDDRDAGLAVVGGVTTSKSQYGYNTIMASDYLGLRYNTINLATLSTTRSTDFIPELAFYIPTYQINQETGALQPIQGVKGLSINSNTLNIYNPGINGAGNKGLELNANGLYLYKPLGSGEVTQSTAAQLTATGLNITEGSIILGDIIKNYRLTKDTTIVEGKIYYTYISGGDDQPGTYAEASNPDVTHLAEYYELVRQTHAFEVDSNGYLNAQAGWIGGADSYVKLEKDVNTGTHYLDIRLSQLEILLNGDLYGHENVVNVLDIIAQQNDFINLWNGEVIWLYAIPVSEPTGNPRDNGYYELIDNYYVISKDTSVDLETTYYSQPFYIVHSYIDNDTDETYYFYDGNQDKLGQYFKTSDTIAENKEYFEISEVEEVIGPTDSPLEQGYYERNGNEGNYIYILSTDKEPDEQKTYYIVDFELVENLQPGTELNNVIYYEPYESLWIAYDSGEISSLPSINIAGLSQSLKFTNDSLGHQQKLIVSSSRNDELEKTSVEIDPQFIKFLVQSDNASKLEFNIGYNNNTNAPEIIINSGEETIFSVADDYNYMLDTTTGVKIGPLGMFHYKNGLAIGLA